MTTLSQNSSRTYPLNRNALAALKKLIKYADLDLNNFNSESLEAEVIKWNPRHIRQLTAATGRFPKDQLSYVLRLIFEERNSMEELQEAWRHNNPMDSFQSYGVKVISEMSRLGLSVYDWLRPMKYFQFKATDWSGKVHNLMIQPIFDPRVHLTVANDMPEVCSAALVNADAPYVNVEYYLDPSIRTFVVSSDIYGDDVAYFRLVALKDLQDNPVLGLTYTAYVNEFKNHPTIVSRGLDYLFGEHGRGGFSRQVGFSYNAIVAGHELNDANSQVQVAMRAEWQSLRTKINDYETGKDKNIAPEEYANLIEAERTLLEMFKQEFYDEVHVKDLCRLVTTPKDSSDWSGTTYLDIFGGDLRLNMFAPSYRTIHLVDGKKGHNYDMMIALYPEKYIKLAEKSGYLKNIGREKMIENIRKNEFF